MNSVENIMEQLTDVKGGRYNSYLFFLKPYSYRPKWTGSLK